jgi:hypothetical protein
VSVTFSNLILVNGPPGPPSTYPLGMSSLMMWSIDMDRRVAWSGLAPGSIVCFCGCY